MEEWDLDGRQAQERGDLARGFCLEQWFSSSRHLPYRGQSAVYEDIFVCHTRVVPL